MRFLRSNLALFTLVSCALAASISPIVLAQPQSPAATSTPEARLKELLRTGIAAYRNKDYPNARVALADAIKISPVALAVGTLADVEMRLNRHRDAAEHWTLYLTMLASDQASERKETLQQLDICLKYVGSVTINVKPNDAAVLLDGSPLDPAVAKAEIWMDPGNHSLQARTAAGTSEAQTVSIRAGEKTSVTLVAPSRPSATAAAPIVAAAAMHTLDTTEAAPARHESPSRIYVLIGGSVLTLLASGIGTTYWAMNRSAKSDADSASQSIAQQTDDRGICASSSPARACSDLRSAHDNMKRTADISDYSFVAAGVLGAATLAAYLLWPSSEKPARQGHLVVTPYWSPAGPGITGKLDF